MSQDSNQYIKGMGFVFLVAIVLSIGVSITVWRFNTWEKAQAYTEEVRAHQMSILQMRAAALDIIYCMETNETASASDCGYDEFIATSEQLMNDIEKEHAMNTKKAACSYLQCRD